LSLPDDGPRARVRDLPRPARLYAGIDARPTFVLPTLLLVASAVLYLELAARRVLPSLVSDLLDRALVTESALRRMFHAGLLVGSFLVPVLWMPLAAFVAWLVLRASRERTRYPFLMSLIAYSALWIALGFVAKGVIVLVTGLPAPSTNVGAFVLPRTSFLRALAALTNPFLLASIVWTARGLRYRSVDGIAAWTAGAAPWVLTAVVFATSFPGGGGPGIGAPVPVDDWPTVTVGCITLRTPPELAPSAEEVAGDLDRFAQHLAERFGSKVRPVRVYLYPDHATLERATGERLHVLITGSIRGTDLLYLEMPGRNAAVTAEQGRRNALRFLGLMELAPAAPSAPRWFVEGVVHAVVEPGTSALDRDFRAMLVRRGLPSLEVFVDGTIFRTPDGALLARSLVDHIAALHGPDTLVDVMRDVVGGEDFRDALFARTRLTASELETGWQDSLRHTLAEERSRGATPAAGADSAGADSTRAALPRNGR
jgi:hypothetical protein